MGAIRTARERARAELTQEIKAEARRQLGASGAQGLSLRAVARELGMASSALYRYFPSRDDLLTALIIDAYNALGDRLEAADRVVTGAAGAAGVAGRYRERWQACCSAVREWAQEHPHEYSLLYGSPVPGYAAPETTIPPAARVPLVITALVRDAWEAGELIAAPGPPLSPQLAAQASALAEQVAPGAKPQSVANAIIAWTQLFGMVGFELYGHLVGSMDPAGPFFDYAVERMADLIGLPPATSA